MDNAIIVDGVLAVALLAGVLIGAKRGLFKSLMGLIVVVAALFGAVWLADTLTEPITDIIAPKVEDSLVRSFSEALERKSTDAAGEGRQELAEALEKYGIPKETTQKLLSPLTSAAQDMVGSAKQKAVEAFREAVSASVRKIVRGTVHTVLVFVLYIVLLFVLKLLARLLDHVFDLPVLSTVNDIGGAAIGLLETALVLFVAVHVAARLGVEAVAKPADGAVLLPFFLEHSPIELITSLSL